MSKKVLIGVIVVLAAALIFETAYVIGRGQRQEKEIKKTPSQSHPLASSARRPVYRYQALDDFGRWDPFEEMTRVQEAMHRMFEDSFAHGLMDRTISRSSAAFEPDISIHQKNDAYIVKADLPGMDKSAIDIEVSGRLLTISGERKEEETKQEKGFYRQELSYGSFSRSIMLPEDVKAGQIASDYRDGVLTITIPREPVARTAPSKVKIPVQ